MNFLMKKMVKSQIKNLPEDQQQMILKLVEENPELFTKMSKEIKEKTKAGVDQQTASMTVMMKYKGELQKLMQK